MTNHCTNAMEELSCDDRMVLKWESTPSERTKSYSREAKL